jgi:TRAP-type transport system periplasmic protein
LILNAQPSIVPRRVVSLRLFSPAYPTDGLRNVHFIRGKEAKMKTFFSILGLACLVALATPAGAQEQWIMATPYPENIFHEVNVKQFAREIEEGVKGKIKITTHHGASLFKHPEIKTAVKSGQIQLAEYQLDNFANQDEFYNFDCIPFMATSFDETSMLWEAAMPLMDKRFKREGVKLLYWAPWPSVGFYTKKQVNTIADLKGMKMRTFNRLGADLAKALGMQPVVVSAAEIAQAFSTNLIDSMITSTATGVSVQAWDFVRYFQDARVWHGTLQIVINEQLFLGLPADTQKVIVAAGDRAAKRVMQMAIEASDSQKKILSQKGMVVSEPSEEFKRQTRAIAQNMMNDWVKLTGEDGRQFVAKYEELRRTRKITR